jgi:hypothetical protein
MPKEHRFLFSVPREASRCQWRTSCPESTSTYSVARSRCSKSWTNSASTRLRSEATSCAGRAPFTVRRHLAADRFPSTWRGDDINASAVDRKGISWSSGPKRDGFGSTMPPLISAKRWVGKFRGFNHHEHKGTEKRNRYFEPPKDVAIRSPHTQLLTISRLSWLPGVATG